MAPPCTCKRFIPGQPWIKGRDCRRCWLYAHDAKYTRQWNERHGITSENPSTVVISLRGQPKPLPAGPGTELKKLLLSLGIASDDTCWCNKRAALMNEWGIAECRERRSEIASWLREKAEERSWVDKLQAARLAITTGIALSINPLDLYGSLVDIAIERARMADPNTSR